MNKPKDSFWSVTTIPFRVLLIILLSFFYIPLTFLRKIWAPHLPSYFIGRDVYVFIRYGDYKDEGEDWD